MSELGCLRVFTIVLGRDIEVIVPVKALLNITWDAIIFATSDTRTLPEEDRHVFTRRVQLAFKPNAYRK